MATGLLGIGASALLANQQALATVSHNLANATVEGYSRQTVTMQARPSQLLGSNFFGTGVDVGTVRRNVDQFINQQIYSESGLQSHLQVEQKYLERVDNLLAGGTTGLSSSMDDFFAALQDLSLDPASLPQREVALQTADTLRQRFQSIGQTISDLDREINQEITDQIGKVNALSTSLADLNQALGISNARGGGQAASDLLDQRDRLIGQLSNFVPVTTADQGDGTINVFIGNGQALVVGSKSFDLATTQNSLDASRLEITYQGVGNVQISREITSGSLGGLINARSLVVDPALNQLGRLAVGVSQTANAQHQLGMDLDGLLGGNLFTVGSAEVNADPANAGITGIGVTITDISALTGSDYRLDVDGSSDYILTNLTDNSTQNLGAVPAGPGNVDVVVDGMTISLDPAAAVGDALLIRPTRLMAQSFSLTVSDPRKLAAALPIISSSSLGNTGSGKVDGLQMVDATNAAFSTTAGALTPPLMVRFTAPGTYTVFDNSVPATPVALEAGIAYTPGADLFPTPGAIDPGYRMQISGTPGAGDEFEVNYNSAGIGDNQNMQALINQQDLALFSGGSATYQESYQQLVGQIGAHTSSGGINLEAVGFSLSQSVFRQQSVSGVNLDEEAANLLQFQQAFQAAAQTISTADTIFQTLIGVT